jgi:hypothetical protein
MAKKTVSLYPRTRNAAVENGQLLPLTIIIVIIFTAGSHGVCPVRDFRGSLRNAQKGAPSPPPLPPSLIKLTDAVSGPRILYHKGRRCYHPGSIGSLLRKQRYGLCLTVMTMRCPFRVIAPLPHSFLPAIYIYIVCTLKCFPLLLSLSLSLSAVDLRFSLLEDLLHMTHDASSKGGTEFHSKHLGVFLAHKQWERCFMSALSVCLSLSLSVSLSFFPCWNQSIHETVLVHLEKQVFPPPREGAGK